MKGQMTVEEIIEDIERERPSRRVYIPLVDISYEGCWPLMVNDDGKSVMADPSDGIEGYVTREEAQEVAERGSTGSGNSAAVWEIVLPAERIPLRGESESGGRG